MCRWLAYSGAPLYLENLMFEPEHSIIDQSLSAHRGVSTTTIRISAAWPSRSGRTSS